MVDYFTQHRLRFSGIAAGQVFIYTSHILRVDNHKLSEEIIYYILCLFCSDTLKKEKATPPHPRGKGRCYIRYIFMGLRDTFKHTLIIPPDTICSRLCGILYKIIYIQLCWLTTKPIP